MNIHEYRESKLMTKVTADIAERWQKRVVSSGLDKQGRAGGIAYLDTYGKRIGAKKCIKFAVQAELMEAQEFANVLWEKAFTLEEGEYESMNLEDTSETILIPTFFPTSEIAPEVDGLPPYLQPGKIATLQPQNIDRDGSIEALLEDDEFYIQPKYDGHRLLAICTPDEIWYQKRSLKLEPASSEEINRSLQQLATTYGIMILDGELFWEDYLTLEHRTAPQALTVNINAGKPEIMPTARYVIFDCLYIYDTDVTNMPFTERWEQLRALYNRSPVLRSSGAIGLTVTFTNTANKQALLDMQAIHGREGVVFRKSTSAYIAGKSGTAYRHKFLMEHKLKVTGLTETTAEDRTFGAIETELGSIGTGFTDADQLEIKQAYDKGDLKIEVVSQGLTENGKLWHPRFIKIIE